MIFGLQIILYVQQSSSSDSVCNAVVYFFVSMCPELNKEKKQNTRNRFTSTCNMPVTDWTDCSHWCLNVIFHYNSLWRRQTCFSLPMEKKTKKNGSTDECVTAFFHFSFPYVNIVVLEEYHFSRMQEYFSFFLSCQDFPETHTGSDTLAGRLQTVRAAQTRHLWWNELKSLWCRASLWGWFQLLCALQGHPLTASPAKLEMAPVHLPYS